MPVEIQILEVATLEDTRTKLPFELVGAHCHRHTDQILVLLPSQPAWRLAQQPGLNDTCFHR